MPRALPALVAAVVIALLALPLPASGARATTVLTVRVLDPNGGESWMASEVHLVNWTGALPAETTSLHYSNTSNIGPWILIQANAAAPFAWEVPNDPTIAAWVRVEVRNASGALVGEDVSDAPFTIVRLPDRTARVLHPNGGERFVNGSAVFIRWDSDLPPDARARLAVGCSPPWSDLLPLADGLPPSGMHLWAANLTGKECLVRLEVRDKYGAVTDHSDGVFQVFEPLRASVSYPRRNDSFLAGSTIDLRWRSSGGATRLLVNVSVSWRGESLTRLATDIDDAGRFGLTTPRLETSNATFQVEVRDLFGNNASARVTDLSLLIPPYPYGRIVGTLSTDAGPVANGALRLHQERNDSPPRLLQAGTSGGDGNFTFDQLPPGRYLIEAEVPGYEVGGIHAAVEANRTTVANLTLRPSPRAALGPPEALTGALLLVATGVGTGGGVVAIRRRRKRRAARSPPGTPAP